MLQRSAVLAVAVLVCVACGSVACSKKESAEPSPAAGSSLGPASTAPAAVTPGAAPSTTAAAPPVVAVPAGAPPRDGKYERVTVDGVTVPMINVMNGGAVVLVDTDGRKPRSWEEQYKRKRELPNGQYDVHKTNTNKNETFDDDTIDKEGLWVIDAKGNLTKH